MIDITPTLTDDGCAVTVAGVVVDEAWAYTLSRMVRDAATRRHWRDEVARVDAALAAGVAYWGLTDVAKVANSRSMYGEWLARNRAGLPVVLRWQRGIQSESADTCDRVGPGPALEGRVHGGRRWYPQSELVGRIVKEWRVETASTPTAIGPYPTPEDIRAMGYERA